VLVYSVGALIISILLMWYAIANAVTNPVLRPLVVRTPGRMAMINIARLATTVLGVVAIRELTTNLLEWQPGVGPEAAQQAAAESVHTWIRGKD
jgi:hypothetical protein